MTVKIFSSPLPKAHKAHRVSEAIHTNNNGFSINGVAINYLFLLILKINKIVNINNGKIIAKNIPAFNPI